MSDSGSRLEGSTGMVWKPLVRSVGTLMKAAFCSAMVVVTVVEVLRIKLCVELENALMFASVCCLPYVNLYTTVGSLMR